MEKTYAKLSAESLSLISKYESELREKTGADVILVAYEKQN